jgi:hypothetical protein
MKLFRVVVIVLIALTTFLLIKQYPIQNFLSRFSQKVEITEIQIESAKLFVETASNETQWSHGLSNITELKENNGMMFIFPTSERRSFWMKDTHIPLDLIWISDNKIVGIVHMFPELAISEQALTRYYSPVPIDMTIETNLNWTERNNIKVGDIITK